MNIVCTGGVAYRAHLTSAKGFVQLLRRRVHQEGNEQTATELGRIDALLDRMGHRINDLHDGTTLEAGMLRLHPTMFAIDDLVCEIIEELGSTLAPKLLLIEESTRAEVYVYADRDRTEQVIMNVLTNAIKYAPGTEPIKVSVVADEERVTVSVHDHGSGIPADQQADL